MLFPKNLDNVGKSYEKYCRGGNTLNKPVEKLIVLLNDILTKSLLENTKNKKVLLDLSGGHDTRVNLSILLNNDINFTAYTIEFSKGDIKISKKIAKEYGFDHIIDKNERMTKKELIDSYDIKIGGRGYSEQMCALHKMNKSFNMIRNHLLSKENIDFFYSPAIEKEVINCVKDIPIGYLVGGIIQKDLIRLNEPNLLKFPFTYYDWRHYMLNRFYPYFADMIFNSYYRGKGRNYFDNKKKKDRWWDEKNYSFKDMNY